VAVQDSSSSRHHGAQPRGRPCEEKRPSPDGWVRQKGDGTHELVQRIPPCIELGDSAWRAARRCVRRLGAGCGEAAASDPKPTMTVYGFAMIDVGQNFTQIDPNW